MPIDNMAQPSVTMTQAASPGFLRRYLFATDHKVVGLQYFFLSLAAVLIGTVLSLLMRIHLAWPGVALPFFGQIKPENYLAYLTMHGTLMRSEERRVGKECRSGWWRS